mmetsp:Transcript_15191/g.19711  ORF Transcript_15191/g.19711 Transcript_15191/m.19711 type:complete len:687 (-) Transcript_15191:416-2476(-)
MAKFEDQGMNSPNLMVEIIGFGEMRTISQQGEEQQHLLYVLSVQQQASAWTVYRRVATFQALTHHLSVMVPNLPPCPNIFMASYGSESVETLRIHLQHWMQQILSIPIVSQTPVMKNFLCAEANLPPPGVDITWTKCSSDDEDDVDDDDLFHNAEGDEKHHDDNEFDDEMDMDDLFDRHLDEDQLSEGDPYDTQHHFIDRGGGGGGGGGRNSGNIGSIDSGSSYSAHSTSNPYSSSLSNGWQTVEPGVAHSFTQKNLLAGGKEDPDSDFDEDDMIGAEVLDTGNNTENVEVNASQTQVTGSMPVPVNSSGGGGGGSNGSGVGVLIRSSSNQAVNQTVNNGIANNDGTSTSAKCLENFKILTVIGKGSFGKVFLVRDKYSGTIFAMKVLRKDNIIKRNQVEHTRTERSVLGYVKHPFIVGLRMAFQTSQKLFFVLDYCAGGELFFHLGKLGKFPEVRARFYAAEITLALGYVHKFDIIYRDLKPENVLLDDKGHVRLTDFGLSKEGISNNSSGANSFCGTPEYLAPEILSRSGHGRAVDWWSLGALLYEMLTGLPPFYCRDREKLFEKIRNAELTYPKYLSREAQNILKGLLTRDPSQRLGSGPEDVEEVKAHPFFSNHIQWDLLAEGRLAPPWEPTVLGSLDTSQFDNEFTSMPINSPLDSKGSMLPNNDNTFAGFSFSDQNPLGP